MATDDHGKCLNCNTDLNGGNIWEYFYQEYMKPENNHRIKGLSSEEAKKEADKTAAAYGATRTEGKWGREIGIEKDRDRIEEWECPDCKHRWSR